MTTPEVILSLSETTLERVVDLYAGGSLHSIDTLLNVAGAEAPYGDTLTYLKHYVDYHENLAKVYTALVERVELLRSINQASEPLTVQLPETD